MRGKQWLLLLVIAGLVASGVQLNAKAETETLWRQIGLAVDAAEVDPSWWAPLQDSGVNYALVHHPVEMAGLPQGILAVARISAENWPAWQVNATLPAIAILEDNLLPEQAPAGLEQWPQVPVGLIDLLPPGEFALRPGDWANRLLRVYDRPAHRFISEFTSAVRERQADLVVVRLFPDASWEENLSHVQSVAQALLGDGHQLGAQLGPRLGFPVWLWVYYLQAIGLGALLILVAGLLWEPQGKQIVVGWLLLLAGMVALASTLPEVLGWVMVRQLWALASAIAYPLAGFIWWWRRVQQGVVGWATGQALVDWLIVSISALAGGLSVHAWLSLPVFQLKQFQFLGVKLAYAIPIGIASLLIVWLWWRQPGHAGQRTHGLWRGLGAIMGLAVLAIAVYVLLNRAGNQSAVPIGQWELTLREWLDRALWVRPRFKEFLGYPVLIAGFFLWRRGSRLLAAPAVLVGFIAELSLVNTFEHLHHPLLLSLMRSALGLGIGLGLGLIGLVVLRSLWPVRESWR
jgi:hypothetical protein